MNDSISVVTCLFNESENVQELCEMLDAYAATKPYALELVFVNDGSTDNTYEQLQNFSFMHAVTKLVNLSRNFGSHAALRAGLTVATQPYTMLFSGDLQEPVELIELPVHHNMPRL